MIGRFPSARHQRMAARIEAGTQTRLRYSRFLQAAPQKRGVRPRAPAASKGLPHSAQKILIHPEYQNVPNYQDNRHKQNPLVHTR
jgi:hypothetical protein